MHMHTSTDLYIYIYMHICIYVSMYMCKRGVNSWVLQDAVYISACRYRYTHISNMCFAATFCCCGESGPSSCGCIIPIRQLYGDYTETIRKAWICLGFPDTLPAAKPTVTYIYIYIYIYTQYIHIYTYIYIYIYKHIYPLQTPSRNGNGHISTPALRKSLLTIAFESSRRDLQLVSHWHCRKTRYVKKKCYMHIYIYICICIHIYMYVSYIRMHASLRSINIYIYTYIYVYIYIYISEHMTMCGVILPRYLYENVVR